MFSMASNPRRRWWLLRLLILGILVDAAAPVAAQQAAGSVIGHVTDESGGVLPGVTVAASGAALQVENMAAVTNENGEYRIASLPIGIYVVEFTLPGFQTIRREGVRLTAGFVARIDVSLKVGSLEEAITVTAASPVVDVKSTGNKTMLTKETLELLPVARNGIVGIISQAPGVRSALDVGGSSGAVPTPSYRAFGQAGLPWPQLEGVATATLQPGGGNASWFDQSAVEEAVVQTVASGPEYPTRGVQLQIIMKSGGDSWHGGAFWSQTSSALQSNNITDELRTLGIRSGNKLLERWDVSGDVGGKIVQHKLWFYGSLRKKQDYTEALNAFKPDGSPANNGDGAWFHTEKVSYQATTNNKFIGFYQGIDKELNSGVTALVPYESRTQFFTVQNAAKIEWQYAKRSALVDVQYGEWWYTSTAGSNSDRVGTVDLATGAVTGEWVTAGQVTPIRRRHPRATLTYFKENLLGGSHEFKLGTEFMIHRESRSRQNKIPGNYRLVFSNNVARELETWNYPTVPMQRSNNFSVYLKDSWSVNQKMTLNLGVRIARDDTFVPASCREAGQFAVAECYDKVQLDVWNSVSPRLHFAYDLFGTGRTLIKGGWGRFAHMRQADPEIALVDPQDATTSRYRWTDPNGNRAYDVGEVNLNPNGPDFISTSGGVNGVANPNDKQPTADEYSLTIEHELLPTVAVRATGIYSNNFNNFRRQNNLRPYDAYNIPVTRPDPGPDGRVGTGDDGGSITYYEFPTSLRGAQFEEFMLVNDATADQSFTSFELALFRRFQNGWELNASYAATKKSVPLFSGLAPAEFSANVVVGELEPNSEIFAGDNTWESMGKIQGAYNFPLGIQVSGSYEMRSGQPWARQAVFTGGATIPNIVLRTEEIGARRLSNTHLVALRLQKRFNLGKSHKVDARLNIYNLTNTNAVTSVQMRSGATFGRPLAIVPPRIAEFSATYSF